MKQSRLFAAGLAAALAFGAPSLIGRAFQSGAAAGARRAVRRPALAADRAGVDVGPHRRHRRLRAELQHLVRRHRARRRVEDREQRHHLRGAVPGPGPDVDRRHRRVAEQPRPRLRRHRRVEQPPEHVVGRRRLQVDRRRQDLHEHRPQDLAPHQPHRHRPARQRHGVGRGDRCALRTRRRARHLQDDRRRRDLEADAEDRRRHRRERPRRSIPPTTRSSTPRPTSGGGRRAA